MGHSTSICRLLANNNYLNLFVFKTGFKESDTYFIRFFFKEIMRRNIQITKKKVSFTV